MAPTQLELMSEESGMVVKKYSAGTVVKIGRGPAWSSDSVDSGSGTFRSHLTKSMSQQHATLSWEGDQPMIEDNKSTNGTWVLIGDHKKAITPGLKHHLENGQTVIFGKEISTHDVVHKPLRLKVNIVTLTPAPSSSQSIPLDSPPPYPAKEMASEPEAGPSQTQQNQAAPALEDVVVPAPVTILRKVSGFGLSENELVEDSGSDMNLDTENDAAFTDQDDDDGEDDDEEIITDGEATGWHPSHPIHSSSGLNQIKHATLAAADSVEQAIFGHNGLDTIASFPLGLDLAESVAESDKSEPGSDHSEGENDEMEGCGLDEDESSDFYGAKSRKIVARKLAGDLYDDDDAFAHSPSRSPESELAATATGLAHFEDILFGRQAIDSGPEVGDDDEDSTLSALADANIDPLDCLPPPSQFKQLRSPTQRPAGRVPSPFLMPTLLSAQEPVKQSAVSPLPSPESSPQQDRPKYFAKRSKPPRIVDEDDEHNPIKLNSVHHRPLARDYSSRHKANSASRKRVSLDPIRAPFGSYGTIRQPRAGRYLGESEDDECASSGSHLPSPKNSPERAPSPELGSEPEIKRAKLEPVTRRAKVDWTPVVELIEMAEAEHEEGSVMEGVFDGLNEVDGEGVEAELEIDGDALQENDEVVDDVDVGQEAVAELAGAEEEEAKVPCHEGLAKLLAELDQLKCAAHETAKRAASYELDSKPNIPVELISSTSSAHPPPASPSLSPKKRGHAQLDDPAELSRIVDDCVAHVAEEARAVQTEPQPSSTLGVAPLAEADKDDDTSAAVPAPVDLSPPAGLPPADKVLSTQTEPVEVTERPIAPLPKRARGRGLVTFLSGMAVAVVGMECLGILAGMMED